MNELNFSDIVLDAPQLQMLRAAAESPIDNTEAVRSVCRVLCSYKLMTPSIEWTRYQITQRGRQYLAWLDGTQTKEKKTNAHSLRHDIIVAVITVALTLIAEHFGDIAEMVKGLFVKS